MKTKITSNPRLHTSSRSFVKASATNKATSGKSALGTIFDRYLNQTCERFPEYASHLGLSEYQDKLSINSPAEHQAQIKLIRQTLEQVEELPEIAFTANDWLDRKTLIALLRTENLLQNKHQRWRTNPQCHINTAVEAIFELVVHAQGKLGKVIQPLHARLKKLPDFLAAGAECVFKPDPLWTSLAEKNAQGANEFLKELEPELLLHSPQPQKLKSDLAASIRAIEDYQRKIERKRTDRKGSFALGSPDFEFLMRERLGYNWSVREAIANGQRLINQMQHELEEEAKRLGRKKADDLLHSLRQNWHPEQDLLSLYKKCTLEVKKTLLDTNLIPLPKKESLQIIPVPPFMRHQFPTAAYTAPGPFAKKQTGIFWVNDLSLHALAPSTRLQEQQQHFGLGLTCAHEAYPGHHVQLVTQNDHPSKIRRLASHSIYYEGWTLWCEKLVVEHQFIDDPYLRLLQRHDALWRAYRIVIDCGLQSGSLSYDAACKILMNGVGFTRGRAEADVNWYTSSPTVPMSYLLGRLEVEKLHHKLVIEKKWSLYQFHSWLLSFGSIPWTWIWQSELAK